MISRKNIILSPLLLLFSFNLETISELQCNSVLQFNFYKAISTYFKYRKQFFGIFITTNCNAANLTLKYRCILVIKK